ncbi:MAG: hypothetical protein ABI378_06275 [Chitinophagaceae bacterium]
MFKRKRVLFLVVTSLIMVALLYWLDSDKPSDSIVQKATFTTVAFVVFTILYASIYGLLTEINKIRDGFV